MANPSVSYADSTHGSGVLPWKTIFPWLSVHDQASPAVTDSFLQAASVKVVKRVLRLDGCRDGCCSCGKVGGIICWASCHSRASAMAFVSASDGLKLLFSKILRFRAVQMLHVIQGNRGPILIPVGG